MSFQLTGLPGTNSPPIKEETDFHPSMSTPSRQSRTQQYGATQDSETAASSFPSTPQAFGSQAEPIRFLSVPTVNSWTSSLPQQTHALAATGQRFLSPFLGPRKHSISLPDFGPGLDLEAGFSSAPADSLVSQQQRHSQASSSRQEQPVLELPPRSQSAVQLRLENSFYESSRLRTTPVSSSMAANDQYRSAEQNFVPDGPEDAGYQAVSPRPLRGSVQINLTPNMPAARNGEGSYYTNTDPAEANVFSSQEEFWTAENNFVHATNPQFRRSLAVVDAQPSAFGSRQQPYESEHRHNTHSSPPPYLNFRTLQQQPAAPFHTSYSRPPSTSSMSLSQLSYETRNYPVDYPQTVMNSHQEHELQRYPSPPPPLGDNPYPPQGLDADSALQMDMPELHTPEKEEPDALSPGRSKPIPKPDREVTKGDDGRFLCTWPGCTEETRVFNRKCEWSKHMDKHDRPYKCPAEGCEKLPGFTYSGGLLRHQREVHNLHGGPRKQLNCPHPNCKRYSGKGFSRQENLNEHLRRVHTDTADLQMPMGNGEDTEDDGSERAGMKRKRGLGDDENADLRQEMVRLRAENEELRQRSDSIMKQLQSLQNMVGMQNAVSRGMVMQPSHQAPPANMM